MCGKSKSWPMTPCKSFVAAASLLCVLVALLLMTAVGKDLLVWFEKHPALAAWLQLPVLLATGLLSYYLGGKSFRDSKREEAESAARTLALAYSYIRLMFFNWDEVNFSVGSGNKPHSFNVESTKNNVKQIQGILEKINSSHLNTRWSKIHISSKLLLDAIDLKLNQLTSEMLVESDDDFHFICNEIMILISKFISFQKDLVDTSGEKYGFFSPSEIMDELNFDFFKDRYGGKYPAS